MFEATANNSAMHIQSGLVCPMKLGSTQLLELATFPGPHGRGSDVACDYLRASSVARFGTSLTIFAIRADDGMTVDDAFKKYQAEVKGVSPGAVVLGPAIKFANGTPEPKDLRSEEYSITINRQRYQSDLIVMIRGKWIIEIRGTTPMQIPPDEAAVTATDLALPVLAMTQASTTISPD